MVYRTRQKRLAWLLVEDVPAEVKRAEVLEALSAWRLWQRYAAVPAGVSLVVLPEGRWGELEGPAKAPRVSWSELAPAERRITLPVSGELWARCTLAARRSGSPSLQAWATAWLGAAADKVLEDRAS